MDLSNVFAIGMVVLGAVVWIAVPAFLWNAHRRLRDLEDVRDAQDASQRLSEDRGRHPT